MKKGTFWLYSHKKRRSHIITGLGTKKGEKDLIFGYPLPPFLWHILSEKKEEKEEELIYLSFLSKSMWGTSFFLFLCKREKNIEV